MRTLLLIAAVTACHSASEPRRDPAKSASVETAKPKAPVQLSQLRVTLRSNDKLAEIAKTAKHVVTKPFPSDAQWVLVIDSPPSVVYDVNLNELGLSDNEAWKTAYDNSMPRLGAETLDSALMYQDAYAPSALLYPDLMYATVGKRLPDHREGSLLAVVPDENTVLYTIGDATDVAALHDKAVTGSKRSNVPLSVHVMEYDGKAWHEAAGQ